MRKLSIERFDGAYAYCEDDERKLFAIDRGELPSGTKVGDVLKITDDGEISVDEKETAERKARIRKLNSKLWGNPD